MTKTALLGFFQHKILQINNSIDDEMDIHITPTPKITKIFEDYLELCNKKNVAVSFSLEDHKTYYGLYKQVDIDLPDIEDDEEDKYFEVEYDDEETEDMEQHRQCQNVNCMIYLEYNQSIHNKNYCGCCAHNMEIAPCECVVGDEMKGCDHKEDEDEKEEDDDNMTVYHKSIWDRDAYEEYLGWTYYMCWGGGPVGGYLTNGKRVVRYNFTLDTGATFEEVPNKIVVEYHHDYTNYINLIDAPKRKKPTIGRICSA